MIAMAEMKNNIWEQAGKAGLVLGGISIVYMLLTMLTGKFALPRRPKVVLDPANGTAALFVREFFERLGCDTVVIGLPLKLDGTDSPQTEKVREFRQKLENKLRGSGMNNVNIEFYDERLTTVMAEKVLIEADMRRNKRKEIIDRQAAIIILQGYLDSLK